MGRLAFLKIEAVSNSRRVSAEQGERSIVPSSTSVGLKPLANATANMWDTAIFLETLIKSLFDARQVVPELVAKK